MKRRRNVTLAVISLTVVGLGVWIWTFHFRAKRAVTEYKRQLVAAGEKLTIEELIPPPVPLEQNGAAIFLKAAALLNRRPSLLNTNAPPAMHMVAPGKAMIGSAQPDIRDYYEGNTTNSWAEAEAAIVDLAEALELLQQVIDRPTIDFGFDYRQGFGMRLPNLAETKMAAQRLSAAALCDLHRGETAAAATNVRAMLALVRGSADERLVISQLVRIAIAAITVNVNWELLQSPNVTEEQLAALQRNWTELEFVLATENALAMERAMGEMTVAGMRNSGAEFRKVVSGSVWPPGGGPTSSPDDWFGQARQFAGDAWDKAKFKTKETAWRVAWSYPDQLRRLKGDQVLIEAARRARTNGCFRAAIEDQARQFETLGIRPSSRRDDEDIGPADLDFRSMLSQSVLSLQGILNRLMAIENSCRMTVTATALKRCQLHHGAIPRNWPPWCRSFLRPFPAIRWTVCRSVIARTRMGRSRFIPLARMAKTVAAIRGRRMKNPNRYRCSAVAIGSGRSRRPPRKLKRISRHWPESTLPQRRVVPPRLWSGTAW